MDLLFPNIAYVSVDSVIASVNRLILNPLILLFFALAFAYFLYGVVQFLANQDNEEKRSAGKQHMLWGVVGIVIMLGVYFFMNIIIDTFDIEGVDPEEGEVNFPDYNPDWP